MEKEITITYSVLRPKALRNLQVMGKRYVDQNGENRFTKVTVGTAEYPLIDDFMRKAVHDVTAAVAELVKGYAEDDTEAVFTVENTRWTEGIATAFENAVNDYVVTMAVGEYYAMYFQEQSQWNVSRAQTIMKDVVRLAYDKREPEAQTGEGTDYETSADATVV